MRSAIPRPALTLADPILVWYRDMRNKFRLIFASSLSHQFMFKTVLETVLLDALRKDEDVFYHSPEVESAIVMKFLRKHKKAIVFCGDYEQMDAHVSCQLACGVLRMLLNFTKVPRSTVELIVEMLAEYFYVPLCDLTGQVHLGLKNLLSGIGPTNGIENLINKVVILVALYKTCEALERGVPTHLLRVMGDDSALLIAANEIDQDFVDLLVSNYIKCAEAAGLKVQREKQEVYYGTHYFYCRRMYPASLDSASAYKQVKVEYMGKYFTVPLPIYPIDLAYNSLVRPEDEPAFSAPSMAIPGQGIDVVFALFAKIDNAWGDPAAKAFLAKAVERLDLEALVSDLSQHYRFPADWREKVYGAQGWSIMSSPSVNYVLNRYNKLHRPKN